MRFATALSIIAIIVGGAGVGGSVYVWRQQRIASAATLKADAVANLEFFVDAIKVKLRSLSEQVDALQQTVDDDSAIAAIRKEVTGLDGSLSYLRDRVTRLPDLDRMNTELRALKDTADSVKSTEVEVASLRYRIVELETKVRSIERN